MTPRVPTPPPRVAVGDVGIGYNRQGAGPPLLLLHGFTGDADTMVGLATALAPHRTVLSVNLVGHGTSDAPPQPAHYSMDSVTGQVLAVMEAASVSAADAVGYSLGGRVALSLALRAPARITTLVTIGASPGLQPADAIQRRQADDALADSIEADGLESFVDSWMALPMWRSLQSRLGPDAWLASRQQRLRGSPLGFANSLRGTGTGAMPLLHDDLPKLAIPALFLAGAQDEKFVAIATAMAGAAQHGTARIIEDAGHAAHLEQPVVTAGVIREFLGCT